MQESMREKAAKSALDDIRWLQKSSGNSAAAGAEDETYLDGPMIIELLDKNFDRLDPDSNGISRDELMACLVKPEKFSSDEYEMLRLLTRYFDTIINLVDDEVGEQLKITRLDMSALKTQLVDQRMTLKELRDWGARGDDFDVGLPPLA